ncbi:hypothetical protein Cgig2_028971 [Carnegiea gigantea]|uniref:Cation-transporting P-type ATPase N-terminal domain-containing protein n=1 Tax=Carnegiea gigantea TaxID=171969 RepID=A0A9Q1JVJ9_9CARY|nr:hypothetical protein Cgig2_028971 [Carnegiea gigantea]
MTMTGPEGTQSPMLSSPPDSSDPELGVTSQECRQDEDDQDMFDDDPFDIANTKNAPIEALRRWRRAALVLNASRRFRYTLDLKREEEKERRRRMIRAHAQVVRAAILFKLAGQRETGATVSPPTPTGHFGITLDQLCSVTRDQDIYALEQYGGVKGLAAMLNTNSETGVSGEEDDIVKRRSTFGSNTYPTKKGKGFLHFLWESWQDLTLIILIIAAILSLALGIKTEGIKEGWYDGGSIIFAVLLVILVTAISDYRQSLQFQSLNEEKRNIQLEVIRGGRRVKISIYDVVVGDVVPLKIGDQVPADGIFISGHSLAIDESSMTGESTIVHKDKKAPFLLAGCKVADGFGRMMVIGVGINTEWGLLMASISEDTSEETPLQVRLNGLATFIGIVGLSVAGAVLAVLMVRLAYSMRKMMADKALVRRLSSCETMGSATTICSDKTGTLTLNQMTVVEAYAGKKKLNPPSDASQMPLELSTLLIEGIAINTTGSVFTSKNGGAAEVSGSPTEKAILSWGVELGMKFEAVRSEAIVLHVCPFNSEKKRGGVALQLSNLDVHIHWKGAAELVLASCTQFLDADGSIRSINDEKGVIDKMAAESLRCIAFAYKTYDRNDVPNTSEVEMAQWALPEDNLTLLALVGIKDPCRPGVGEAVRLCTAAGVKVRMVTGDNIQTAKAIALECGILTKDADATEPTIIEGKTFHALSEQERVAVAKKITVMGRSSPNDKLLLVQALRKGGDVVAVTGDGTNDAPALHEADIGLSMGISGTEVAKESSDIIILDDNFASVVKMVKFPLLLELMLCIASSSRLFGLLTDDFLQVVRWGRSVYANIQKFIQFQLTVNVAALVINVVAAVSSGSIPLNAVQLLWVNLIMDTLGALALATEPPTDQLMRRAPVGRRQVEQLASAKSGVLEPLVTNIMWRNLLVQVFNEFNARKPDEMNVFKGILKNHLFIGIVGMTVLLQVGGPALFVTKDFCLPFFIAKKNTSCFCQIVIILFLGNFTKTVRLSWQLWLLSISIGLFRLVFLSISWVCSAGFVVRFNNISFTSKTIFSRKKRPGSVRLQIETEVEDGLASTAVQASGLLLSLGSSYQYLKRPCPNCSGEHSSDVELFVTHE